MAVEQQVNAQQGGKKRVVKKVQDKKSSVASKQSQESKQQKQKVQEKQEKKTSTKKGGAIVDDVKTLAVPFAILLAKEGLGKLFKDGKTDKKTKSPSASVKSASKPSSLRRRSTLSGGSCNLGCAAQSGGQAAKELFQLQHEIDRFLEKY
jgi:hypothetical protein